MSADAAAARLGAEIERLFGVLAARRGSFTDAGPWLTLIQRHALAVAVDEGPLRLGALADRIGASDPTATRIVDCLERLGLVERIADPSDRRATRVATTAQGRRTLRRRRAELVALLREPLCELGVDEQERFVRLLSELNDVLAADRLVRSP